MERPSSQCSRSDLQSFLCYAERLVRILGVVDLDADWRQLAEKWRARISSESTSLSIQILCESDNLLFQRAFLTDTEYAEDRRSFQQYRFIKEEAFRLKELLSQGLVAVTSKEVSNNSTPIILQEVHVFFPRAIIQVDDKIFCTYGFNEFGDFYVVEPNSPEYRSLYRILDTFFSPEVGLRYACGPQEEKLELFDHGRVPRGIFPRHSFYDTDFSQLVIWGFVFDRQGRLLIHRRSSNAKDNRDMWDKSVGGHVDFNEDVDTSRAMARELVEELFTDETKKGVGEDQIEAWSVNDEEVIYLGDWAPGHRGDLPFKEIGALKREWSFFRLRQSQQVYSPRELPNGKTRRLRVIADVFLFVAGPGLSDRSLGKLMNSEFKLLELAELKTAMDVALKGEPVSGFEEQNDIPRFSPDLTNVMTGGLRDVLEEFAQYIKRYLKGVH